MDAAIKVSCMEGIAAAATAAAAAVVAATSNGDIVNKLSVEVDGDTGNDDDNDDDDDDGDDGTDVTPLILTVVCGDGITLDIPLLGALALAAVVAVILLPSVMMTCRLDSLLVGALTVAVAADVDVDVDVDGNIKDGRAGRWRLNEPNEAAVNTDDWREWLEPRWRDDVAASISCSFWLSRPFPFALFSSVLLSSLPVLVLVVVFAVANKAASKDRDDERSWWWDDDDGDNGPIRLDIRS
jgi:hypothetical protein